MQKQSARQTVRRVILESPYQGAVRINKLYARACVRDCLLKDEAPIASHLLYTQPGVLRDHVPNERQRGIDAGLAWRHVADATVVYCDLGITAGMQYGIDAATTAGIPIEYRTLGWQPRWWMHFLTQLDHCAASFRDAYTHACQRLGTRPFRSRQAASRKDDNDRLLHR